MSARLNRLFAADGRGFDVAVDHGFFVEGAFLAGIETMERAVMTLVEAGPDAIQLSPGEAPYLQRVRGRRSRRSCSAPTSRTSTATSCRGTCSASSSPEPSSRRCGSTPPASSVNLLQLPDQPELFHQCVRNVSVLQAACDTVGMPLMVEPLVMQRSERGAYGVDGDVEKIVPLVRQAVELGADVVKADPTDDIAEYQRVIEIAGNVPVLVRGGGQRPTRRSCEDRGVMDQGAAGIVYGRNIIQHDDPAAMTRALMGIVHDGARGASARLLHG